MNLANYVILILGISYFGFNTKIEKPTLDLKFAVDKKVISKKDTVQLTYTLKNISRDTLNIANTIAYHDAFWFRLRIEDEKRNVIVSGLDPIYIGHSDLPELVVSDLQPNHEFTVTMNLKWSWMFPYSSREKIKVGKYYLSGVYKYTPDEEDDFANNYGKELFGNRIWVGFVLSDPIEIEISD